MKLYYSKKREVKSSDDVFLFSFNSMQEKSRVEFPLSRTHNQPHCTNVHMHMYVYMNARDIYVYISVCIAICKPLKKIMSVLYKILIYHNYNKGG